MEVRHVWLGLALLSLSCHSLAILPPPANPDEAERLWELGQAAMKQGQPDEAITLYEQSLAAALRGTNQAYAESARPTADIVLPTLSEHTMGQLMQMLMLATVVEGRLMGINPYGQPGVEAYKRNMRAILKS